jgi:hypothetical protein
MKPDKEILMKIVIMGMLLLNSLVANASSDIILSKKIKSSLRSKIERDLTIIKSFKFRANTSEEALSTLGLNSLTPESATYWLNERVNYVIEEKAFSLFNLLFKKVVYVERNNASYPFADLIPYSMGTSFQKNLNDQQLDHEADKGGFTVMSNIGAALYLSGKSEQKVYGLKVSNGFLRPMTRVQINSPRSGIIQIGEGLFAPELTINRGDENALANSIFRLGTFFHEARHSDGHGTSLGFTHAICPEGHDYAGAAACDENLNGPYTVGRVMLDEMTKSCEANCSEADREILNLMIVDNASRILNTTHKGEAATAWDDQPESL